MSEGALFNSESISPLPDHLLTYQYQAGGHGLLAKWADYKSRFLRHSIHSMDAQFMPELATLRLYSLKILLFWCNHTKYSNPSVPYHCFYWYV